MDLESPFLSMIALIASLKHISTVSILDRYGEATFSQTTADLYHHGFYYPESERIPEVLLPHILTCSCVRVDQPKIILSINNL